MDPQPVIDDGAGFAVDAPRPASFGLVGLRERVLMLGGSMSLDSEPGEGTSLSVAIPLKQESMLLEKSFPVLTDRMHCWKE